MVGLTFSPNLISQLILRFKDLYVFEKNLRNREKFLAAKISENKVDTGKQ